MKSIRYEKDAANIVHVIFDNPTESANLMNVAFREDFATVVARLQAEPDLAGVILRSAKSTFFAGADLKEMVQAQEQTAQFMWDFAQPLKQQMRQLETLGKPVVAAINGAALGGGWEICLCAHHSRQPQDHARPARSNAGPLARRRRRGADGAAAGP